MASTDDNRKYPRHQVSVFVAAPAFSKVPMEAKDISAGGLYLVVRGLPAPPDKGAELDVSFQVAGLAYHGCKARVAWSQQNRPGTWGIGLAVEMNEEDRRRLSDALEDL